MNATARSQAISLRPAQAALPLPQQTELILSRLLRHLTLRQCHMLVDRMDQVGGHWGEVSIMFEKGHARRVRITLSVDITEDPHRPDAQTRAGPPKESP